MEKDKETGKLKETDNCKVLEKGLKMMEMVKETDMATGKDLKEKARVREMGLDMEYNMENMEKVPDKVLD